MICEASLPRLFKQKSSSSDLQGGEFPLGAVQFGRGLSHADRGLHPIRHCTNRRRVQPLETLLLQAKERDVTLEGNDARRFFWMGI